MGEKKREFEHRTCASLPRSAPTRHLLAVKLAILLLAAGRGLRMETDTPKAFLPVRGRTLLSRSLARLAALGGDATAVIAVRPGDRVRYLDPISSELDSVMATTVVEGGETRLDSMRRALSACDPDRELILIHDAARPFFPVGAARDAMHRAMEVGAALLAVPSADTLKRVSDEFRVIETLERQGIWLAQTPQIIKRPLLEKGLESALGDLRTATDDVALLEAIDAPIAVVRGSNRNIKITTREDLALAELIADLEDGR